MDLRTPLARVLGHGSAKDGVEHWWWQRLTAVALAPLSIWFVVSLLGLLGKDHLAAVRWLSSPLNATFMILFVVALFHHAQLGLQVVIEDYIESEGRRMFYLVLMKFTSVLLTLLAVVSILQIAIR